MVPSLRIVEPAVGEIRSRLVGMVRIDSPYISGLVQHALGPRGQMLRPSILLAGSLLGGSPTPPPDARTLAVAVELLHCASLLHDDVIDESRVRRGVPTVNAKWGNKEAVLLGDYFLARAIECIARVGHPKALASVERITRHLAKGQLIELKNAGNWELDERGYLEIIEHKTARFFAECVYLGGWAGGLDDGALEELTRYGLSVGMTYQILDDVLDVTGSLGGLGKDIAHDAINGTITLPIIRCLARSEPATRDRVLDALRSRDGEFLGGRLPRLVVDGGALDESIDRARTFAREATDALDRLPGRCPRAMIRALSDVVDYVFARVETGGDAARAAVITAGR